LGLTVIPGREAHRFLAHVSIDKVWGIGPQTAAYLVQNGMPTALAFARRDQAWVDATLTKPHKEIWVSVR
jgi:nucleotidyltransferase/DNA polymerase involved in DNA repair